ncbi:hypothetical protein [Amycolatopsis eburnea]|uniref:Uncharacterized protein n=1 Tax=Amycolatopsis eburnea TaxID=2267691 RepID=A0A3R9F003_9PSEU|nr:hypothetical protein [Amycolatopsis eburnea]RSD26011.1 hypothetical protein EIY87_00905 [Amycolatopsis eburnea]
MPGSPRRPWQLETEVLRVGALASEPVEESRRKFHEWLARRLVTPVAVHRPASFTRYIPADDIRNSVLPSTEILGFTTSDTDREVKIIDCSGNRYGDMGENFLHWVALCAAKFATRPEQLSVVLLPNFPHNTFSPFWTPILDMPAEAGTVVVVNKAGQLEPHGHPLPLSSPDPESFQAKYRGINGAPRQDFEDKVIRRIGHFEISEQYCSHFFFDGSRAVTELAEVLHDTIVDVTGKRTGRTALIVPAKTDAWMEGAVTAAANRLNVPWSKWPEDPANIPKPTPGTTYMFLLDFINTGATYTRVVQEAVDADYKLHRYSIAAFKSSDFHTEGNGLPAVQHVKAVVAERVSREQCDQCALRLPHTDKQRNDFAGLRSYDAWYILTSVEWKPEVYGPPEAQRLLHFPPFATIFARFGDCLAYKLEKVMQDVAPPGVVIVCPEEPAVQLLIRRMQHWADDRMVAVPLPRGALTGAEGRTIAEIRHLADGTGWGRQLEHLSHHQASVVLLDEINASNATAQQMLRVLKAFQIQPHAYTPIFNFVPADQLDGVQIHSLYEIPSPRRVWS